VEVEVYESNDEVELLLLVYEVLLAEMLTEVLTEVLLTDLFEKVMTEEVENVDTAVALSAELVGDEMVLEGLREIAEDVWGSALLDEDLAAEKVEELELISVVSGCGTSIVTVGALTSMMEYPLVVTVAGLGVTVTRRVWVVSGPSMVWVDITTSVTGGRLSVSMMVFVVGACVCTIVSTIVDAPSGELPLEVAAAPPSTATTE
jgi:hypothetical protein